MDKINYDYLFKGNTFYGKPENLTQIELNPSNFFGSVNSNININIIKLDHLKNKNKHINDRFEKNNPGLKKNPTEVVLNTRKSISNKSQKKTLVLDLDETLIHSSMTPFRNRTNIVLDIDLGPEKYTIYSIIRPFVEEFLFEMSLYYEINLFTASLEQYSKPLLKFIDKNKVIKHVYNREYCKYHEGYFFKDLSIVNRDYKDLIIIDNNPASYLFNKENGIPIKSWFDDPNDNELIKLIPFMKFLGKVYDVRPFINLAVNRNDGQLDYKIVENILNKNIDKNKMNSNNESNSENHTMKKSISENLKKKNNSVNQKSLKKNIIINNKIKMDNKVNKVNNIKNTNDKNNDNSNKTRDINPKDSVKKIKNKYATVKKLSDCDFNKEIIDKYNSFRKANYKKKINIIGVHKITIPQKEQGKKIFNYSKVEKKETNNNLDIKDKNSTDNIILKNINLVGKNENINYLYKKKEKNNNFKEKEIYKRNSCVFKDNLNINNSSLSKESFNAYLTQQNLSISKENTSKNQETIDHNYLQTELSKENDTTKENKQKIFNIINNKNHVTELGQKYLKTFRKIKNNKQNFINIKTSKKINLNPNIMKDITNKNPTSLLKHNINTDSKVKIESSFLIPNNEISNIFKSKLKDNYENKDTQGFEIFTPIKVNKVKDKIFKSFKLKPIKTKILFNNVKKYSNNSRNSINDQNLSRSSKKMVVMKIIRTNSIINNSSCLNTENRFSVTYNSTKLNRNSEDFDIDSQSKFLTSSQIFNNKDYISASKLKQNQHQLQKNEEIEKKSRVAKNSRIKRKKDLPLKK